MKNGENCNYFTKKIEKSDGKQSFSSLFMVRVVRLERTLSWSQTRRDTNFAIPGYSIVIQIKTMKKEGYKNPIVVKIVVKWKKAPLLLKDSITKNADITREIGLF